MQPNEPQNQPYSPPQQPATPQPQPFQPQQQPQAPFAAPQSPQPPLAVPTQPIPPTPAPSQIVQPQPPTPLEGPSQAIGTNPGGAFTPTKSKAKIFKLIAIIIAALVFLAGIATALYFYVYVPSLTKVNESDLVSATIADTSFSYPKQWKLSPNAKQYGDELGTADSEGDKSSAAIIVQKLSYVQSGISTASEADVSSIRKSILDSSDTSSIEKSISAGSKDCVNFKNTSINSYNIKSETTVGLVRITTECTLKKEQKRLDAVLLLGNDGYLRLVAVGASLDQWKQNDTVYNKMLDSAKQAN